jgi:hypothetical protein
MVPDDYHDFFLGAVTVAAALVGLLFVAISVHPGGLADDARVAMRVRATCALLAFLAALFVSLVALMPDGRVGKAAVIIGVAGSLSMVTLLAAVLVRRKVLGRRALIPTLVLILGQAGVYIWQITGGIALDPHRDDLAGISEQALIIIVFFGFGVFRAWEYVGGPKTGILGTVDEIRHHPAPATTAGAALTEEKES